MKHVHVIAAGKTDRGSVREENQDQFLIAELVRSVKVYDNSLEVSERERLMGGPLGHLFIVADGMGGHLGGKTASRVAIQYFLSSILNSLTWVNRATLENDSLFTEELRRTLSAAHRELRKRSDVNLELKGMGTTLTLAFVSWPKLFIVHAGDTRCYLLRDKELKLITRDHTVAQQMLRLGQLDPADHERSPWSNVLINALGAGATDVFADIYRETLEDGDRILLCSDGLNKHLTDLDIQRVITADGDMNRAVDTLLSEAIHAGGSDNITAVIAGFYCLSDEKQLEMHAVTVQKEKESISFRAPEEEIDTDEGDFHRSDIHDEFDSNSDSPTLDFDAQ